MISRAIFLWFPMMLIGVGNGILRVKTYGRWMPELAAHQVSCFTGIVFFWLGGVFLCRRYPLPSVGAALGTGALWIVFTVAFEFLFGHFVGGHSWQQLLADYDLSAGRLWPLVLAGVFLTPLIGYCWANRKHGSPLLPRYE